MKALILSILVFVLLSGCAERPTEIGRNGIVVSANQNFNSVLIYNNDFVYDCDTIEIGTETMYLGEAPTQKDVTGRMIKVSVKSGKLNGKVGAIRFVDWSPIDR